MKLAKRLDGIGEYYFSQKLREIDTMNKNGAAVINLGIGSPDLPPHPDVIRVLQEESAKPNVHAYQSYKGSPVLRKAIADWYHNWYKVSIDPETEILPLIGSKEGIMHICMTYLDEGDIALVPNPGYPTYRSAVKLAGGICRDYDLTEENAWQPDFDSLEKEDLTRVKLMWVNYPQMPTGQLADQKVFERLIAFGKKYDILICHDNPYSFILNEEPVSLLAVPGAKEVVLELNSLSKSHNMAGWRVGMLCGAADRINEVLRFKSNMDSGMYLPLQLAAAKALQVDTGWYETVNEEYRRRRTLAYQLLDMTGCNYDKKQVGMFLWAHVPSRFENGFSFSDEYLYKAQVFLTPGGIFGSAGNNYVRISLCSPEIKIAEAITRIKAVL
jgi:LL-diaminopimelate aminotransferase